MEPRTIRVLVADDSVQVLMATSDLVEEYPEAEVVSLAMNVDEAVRLCSEERPDLALIDAWLSGGGVELAAARIKKGSPGTGVAALASSKEVELGDRLTSAGGLGCYEKESLSADLPEILAAIRSRM